MKHQPGFSLVEMMVVVAVAAILAIIGQAFFTGGDPNCDSPDARQGPLVRSRIAQVSGDLGKILLAASRFELSHGRYPTDLAEIGMDQMTDPWGNPYQYLVVFGRQDVGPVRKDHNLKPVNTGFDVYSMGPNGTTASPFASTGGKDDIVVANDGDYMGLACQYNGSGKN